MIQHFLVPGLLGPLASHEGLPRLAHLELLLARADREAGEIDFERAACALFGLPVAAGQHPPSAALCYALETQSRPEGWWLHADPVHLRPDRDGLLVFDHRALDIESHEATECVAAFNAHFAADGLRLFAPAPERWYLQAHQSPQITSLPLGAVTGRDLNRLLPQGRRRPYWHGLLNEVQMLFHGLLSNQQREQHGTATISGLWLSGIGQMPTRTVSTVVEVSGGDLLIGALAANADARGEDRLVVHLAAQQALQPVDHSAWITAVSDFDRLLGASMQAGDECEVHLCNGAKYRWRSPMRRRLWRRTKPFVDWIQVP